MILNIRIFVCLFLCAATAAGMLTGCSSAEEKSESLLIWYDDEKLTGYLEQSAHAYEQETGVRVTYELMEHTGYLDKIYELGINEEKETPDMYLLRSDELGCACMLGIAAHNTSGKYTEKNFCKTALDAASYQGNLMAYPLCFQTTCMIYNGACFQETPVTMGAITAYSETEAVAENQQILYWDIEDYKSNYAFVGNYMKIGGQTGDDGSEISICNKNTEACLKEFYKFGQYFAVGSDAMQEKELPKAFMEGRTICVLTNSDVVQDIVSYATEDAVAVVHKIGEVPALGDELLSCAGAYTKLLVVNALSAKVQQAHEFAGYLAYENADRMYETSGCFAARAGVTYEDDELSKLYEIYKHSQQFPQFPETQDLQVNLEILFSNVLDGNEIQKELNKLEEKIALRIGE